MNRGHGRHIPRAQRFPVPDAFGAQFLRASWRLVVQPRASVAEKWSSTNRIRSQFARIKAAARHRYRVWLLRKTRLYGTKSPAFRGRSQIISQTKRKSGHFAKRKSEHFEYESQEMSGP